LYLLYSWNKAGRKVFGGTDKKDVIAFFVLIVSGLNLGLVPLLNSNIGMGIFRGSESGSLPIFFLIGGVIYIIALIYLFGRWKGNGERLF